ncbi:hypothetical protein AVEN_135449-1 [Araneus ventricosus]|uniref:Uncharacterized protein n=1 Tax=Araneus ventricosus TaxID=182803 RepID=A0A4Y2BD09_ARAVE|nr:hypothetical protein AVEN_135449-1 [Araneus ventricosus]
MFTLPALLYLKVLPLFWQCLHYFIVPNKSRPPNAVGTVLFPLVLSCLTPILGRPGQCGYFCTTPTGGLLAFYVCTSSCNAPKDGSSAESGFEPGALLPRSLDPTTRPPRPGCL